MDDVHQQFITINHSDSIKNDENGLLSMHLNTTSFDNNYHQTTTHKLLGVYNFFCRRYIFYICYVCTFSQSYYVIFNDLFTFF